MRDYPDHIRTVVMDAPLPVEANYDIESLENLMRTYDRIFTDCEKDEACQAAFPNIRQKWKAFLQEKTDQPLEIKVVSPDTQDEKVFQIGGKDLVFLLAQMNNYTVGDILQHIQSWLEGDYALIEQKIKAQFDPQYSGVGKGMRLSVWCAEESPFVSQAQIDSASQAYPEITGADPTVFSKSICEIWQVEAARKIDNQAIKSDIPILILSGSYDNETPVHWAKSMLKNFSRGQHLIFEGYHHGATTYWNDPCGMQAACRFFQQPLLPINLPCLEAAKIPLKTD